MAVEAAAGATPSMMAQRTRLLYVESERVLARLWTLAQIARAAGLPVIFDTALEQREMLFDALLAACGQRHYWAVSVPGGVRDGLGVIPFTRALDELDAALPAWRKLVAPNGALNVAGKGLGAISAENARALDLSGVVGRGSFEADDLRRRQPYGAYGSLGELIAESGPTGGGDVAARLVCIVEDLAISLALARNAAGEIEGAAATPPVPLADVPNGTVVTAAVEGPHGAVEVAATLTDSATLAQLRLTTPNRQLLGALPVLLEGHTLAQAPVILASLDLCVECLDL
ncbi:MAG: hypothetical protein ACHQ4H_18930 [Ktedonobacterales bacterium]|jgi:Ni,Fe-hydrogenase III large subunit